jgi:hypothetical protein
MEAETSLAASREEILLQTDSLTPPATFAEHLARAQFNGVLKNTLARSMLQSDESDQEALRLVDKGVFTTLVLLQEKLQQLPQANHPNQGAREVYLANQLRLFCEDNQQSIESPCIQALLASVQSLVASTIEDATELPGLLERIYLHVQEHSAGKQKVEPVVNTTFTPTKRPHFFAFIREAINQKTT